MSIWRAPFNGDLGEVERLVGLGPTLVDARTDRGMTPLILASWSGHLEVVRCLLDKGAAMNQQDNLGHTALWWASLRGRPAVVALLLERGADPSIADENGFTPLINASKAGRLEVLRLILGHPSGKLTINQRDRTGDTALVATPATSAVGVRRGRCWRAEPTPRSPTHWAGPP
jgi:uncharacterized protein